MSAVEVLEICSQADRSERLWRHRIDFPTKGGNEEIYALPIAGWVVGRKARVARIELLHEGRTLRIVPLDISRPDVANLFPQVTNGERCGYSTWVGVVSLPSHFEIEVRAVFQDGHHVTLGTIRAVREALKTDLTPLFQPLMITSLARTGTTWLMSLLSEHPAIVAHRRYPYEMRGASYWMHMLRILAEPANHLQSAHPDSFQYNPSWVGHPPSYVPRQLGRQLQLWFGRTYVEQLAKFCQKSLDDFYSEVAKQQNQDNAHFFAEKLTPGPIPWTIWGLYPKAREIILVRDFRDMVCSIYATNAKRRRPDFGRAQFATDEEHVQGLARQAEALLGCWRSRSAMAHLVRYEDLIEKPIETLETIFAYLDVEGSNATIQSIYQRGLQETLEMREHRTSASIQSSIGRWKEDLPLSLRPLCNSLFKKALAECGYV